jgi:hypothetical protein
MHVISLRRDNETAAKISIEEFVLLFTPAFS